MFNTILIVCVGNICRSAIAERILAEKLGDAQAQVTVKSAGLAAVAGHSADDAAATVAARHGTSVDGHIARQFTADLGRQSDLILVMEPDHKRWIATRYPSLSGKIMLFDQWTGGGGIADPYRKSIEFHEEIYKKIESAASAWAAKLSISAEKGD